MTDKVNQWGIDVERSERGIERVSFTVDLWEPVGGRVEAMRGLTAAAMWWCVEGPGSGGCDDA